MEAEYRIVLKRPDSKYWAQLAYMSQNYFETELELERLVDEDSYSGSIYQIIKTSYETVREETVK